MENQQPHYPYMHLDKFKPYKELLYPAGASGNLTHRERFEGLQERREAALSRFQVFGEKLLYDILDNDSFSATDATQLLAEGAVYIRAIITAKRSPAQTDFERKAQEQYDTLETIAQSVFASEGQTLDIVTTPPEHRGPRVLAAHRPVESRQ